MPKIKF